MEIKKFANVLEKGKLRALVNSSKALCLWDETRFQADFIKQAFVLSTIAVESFPRVRFTLVHKNEASHTFSLKYRQKGTTICQQSSTNNQEGRILCLFQMYMYHSGIMPKSSCVLRSIFKTL